MRLGLLIALLFGPACFASLDCHHRLAESVLHDTHGEHELVELALDTLRRHRELDVESRLALWNALADSIHARVGHSIATTFRLPDGSYAIQGERSLPGERRYFLVLRPDGRMFRGIAPRIVDISTWKAPTDGFRPW